jgi:plastocyanin
MKGIFVALFLALWSLLFTDCLGQATSQYSTVKGTVLLSSNENTIQMRGRYGRAQRSNNSKEAGEKTALIWLESTSVSTSSNPEEPVVLDQKDLSFVPSLLAVRQNGAVRIRNSDPVYHNVFSLSSVKRFDVGRRPKGEYLDITFDKAGVVDVFCDIHSNMRAAIYVMSPNVITWTKVKSGEIFSLDNIEPGRYQLKVFALGYQERSIPIEVSDGESIDTGTLTLNF